MAAPKIPVYTPILTPEDAAAVEATVASGWVSGTAPVVGRFERAFADYCGARGGAAVNSGTTALEVALIALGVGPGDEVLLPALTIISCAQAILAVGATPVLVDVDPRTWGLDVDAALRRVGPRTRAVMAVHLFGHPVDLDRLRPLRDRGIALLEDAAQAIGSRVRIHGEFVRCGSVGDAAAFSFYANKSITTGEGGMVLGASPPIVDRARSAANLFFGREHRYRHEELGRSYRMSGIQAALGLSQLARLDALLERKRSVDQRYRERLDDFDRVSFIETQPWAAPVPWMVAVRLHGAEASEVQRRLAERGIDSRRLFVGLHEQPALRGRGVDGDRGFEVTEALSRHGLYLPSSPDLDTAQIERVCDTLREVLHPSTRTASSREFGPRYASVYDAIYADKPYALEVDRVLAALARFGDAPPARVLDLGCGTGRHAQLLAKRGLAVTAVDRSESMLVAASDESEVRFVQSDIAALSLDVEPFDAALMMFAVLGYQATDEQLSRSLAAVRAHLRPGGLFVADFWLTGAVLQQPPAERATQFTADGQAWVRRARPHHDRERNVVTVHFDLEDEHGVTQSTEVHRVRHFDEPQLRAALAEADLELVHLGNWPDIDAPPTHDGYSACLIARAR
ncbi:MAG: aminotransferase class I/II-fold pyridoxal phosphate-dependent enzyme [Myxococcota bacterium]